MRISMTKNAETRLHLLAEAEKEPGRRCFRLQRIFPGCGVCSGKLFLSLVMDAPREDDTRIRVGSLDFIAAPELIFTAGSDFEVDVNDRGLFIVWPLEMLAQEMNRSFCLRPR